MYLNMEVVFRHTTIMFFLRSDAEIPKNWLQSPSKKTNVDLAFINTTSISILYLF
jgi:hypothetical protein